MPELKLYELTDELEQAYEMLMSSADEDGVIPEDIMDLFNKVSGMFDDKVSGMAQIVKRLQNKAETCKKEEERLAKMRKSFEKKADWLKGYIVNSMQAVGKKKVETLQSRLVLRHSKAVNLFDMDKLSDKFKVTETTVKADKKAIKEVIESGEIVEGAELVENTNLQIS